MQRGIKKQPFPNNALVFLCWDTYFSLKSLWRVPNMIHTNTETQMWLFNLSPRGGDSISLKVVNKHGVCRGISTAVNNAWGRTENSCLNEEVTKSVELRWTGQHDWFEWKWTQTKEVSFLLLFHAIVTLATTLRLQLAFPLCSEFSVERRQQCTVWSMFGA